MNNASLKNNNHKEGSILVLVLIVLSSMTILSVGLAYRTRIEMKLAQANAQRTQAYYLALGGIERIKALLSLEELSPSTIAGICQFTSTAEEEELFKQLNSHESSEGKLLRYSLRDEQGYLNINKSDPAIWENIDSISRECRASILDWTDADDDTSPDGAETDFYERLAPPYVSKNRPCVALKELLFMRGIYRDVYLGKGLNRNSFLDGNKKEGQFQVSPDIGDDKQDLGLVCLFTLYGDGRININTTSKVVLAALPGLDEEIAEAILTYRAGPDGQFGTDDDMCFTSTEDLAKVEGLTELQIELLQQYCSFDSEYFRIFSCARLNNTFECCLMATVRCAEDELQVLYVERLL